MWCLDKWTKRKISNDVIKPSLKLPNTFTHQDKTFTQWPALVHQHIYFSITFAFFKKMHFPQKL